MKFNFPIKSNKSILALGSEFDTRMAFYCDGEVIFSENTENLAENPEVLEKFIFDFLRFAETNCNPSLHCNPDIIITDLHPLYNSRKIGAKLAKKWRVPHIEAQHHIAHIFSAVGDYILKYNFLIYGITPPLPPSSGELFDFYGIACDGTGYGLDGNIWGGEVFKISHLQRGENIQRIGHLEDQYLIGSELAVREPARMVISILSKFLSKQEVFTYVKKYYSAREFDLLWNQLEQKFNCPLTTSAGRILDAVSILLGFCGNERKYKHYPIKMLEKHTNMRIYEYQRIEAKYYLKPKIAKNKTGDILNTTELFKYLTENTPLTPLKRGTKKDVEEQKNKLGVMAQRYIIEGLYEIARHQDCKIPLNPSLIKGELRKVFFSGGLAENKIMREVAMKNNIYVSDEIPSGDTGIALGQIMAFLLNAHPRNRRNS